VSTPKQQHRLSPAFEADELIPPRGRDEDSENDGLTPTPSSPASPTTPKSISVSPPRRQNSWSSSHSNQIEPSWEMITVKKRYSPGDLFNASNTNVAATLNAIAAAGSKPFGSTPALRKVSLPKSSLAPANNDDDDEDEDWVNDAPQVIVARSISVTRANSQRKLLVRPTRGSSRTATAQIATIAAQHQQQLPTIVSPASTVSSAAAHSVASSGATSISSANSTNTSVSGADSGPVSPAERFGRLEAKKLDLRREIWGDSRDAVTKMDEQWREQRALTPQMCVVDDEENRKSVWGLIETA
jgi:hypothetical protein